MEASTLALAQIARKVWNLLRNSPHRSIDDASILKEVTLIGSPYATINVHSSGASTSNVGEPFFADLIRIIQLATSQTIKISYYPDGSRFISLEHQRDGLLEVDQSLFNDAAAELSPILLTACHKDAIPEGVVPSRPIGVQQFHLLQEDIDRTPF